MRRNITTAVLYTILGTVLLGIVYPYVVTGISQLFFRDKANGQLIIRDGKLVGSGILGQAFTGPAYFHSRPSSAGTGYDASSSSGSNYAPTSKKLVDRVAGDVSTAQAEQPGALVPIDLVTASASGLDPDITPAAANFQVSRVASLRHLTQEAVRQIVARHTLNRQLGVLGEPRVNVLQLNLDLDRTAPLASH
jgi:potassium-transporting ATPase KdpC subunit